MSTEENKALVLRGLEVYVQRTTTDIFDEYFAPDFVLHMPPWDDVGLEDHKKFEIEAWASAPDQQVTLEDVFAEGDKVAVRLSESGTHTGEWQGVPATGKKFTISALHIYRVADGKIAEAWFNVDYLGLFQQLGLIPPLGEGAG
jgi:predicted ester cyclase